MAIEIKSEVDLTPEMLAALFWGLDNNEQAAFFSALYDCIQVSNQRGETWFRYDEYGTMQWLSLRDGVRKLPQEKQLKAANMIRTIAADFYKYTLGESWDWERLEYEVKP